MDSRSENPTGVGTVRATEVLLAEHTLIQSVLRVLSVMARRARTDGDLSVDDARLAATFLSEFADVTHHAKEEAELFPAMERAGLPSTAGPTAVMRSEHEMGRAHVRALGAALAASPPDLAAFARSADAFVLLLRDHIAKENEILFPMAEQMIPPAVQDELAAVFAREDPAIREHFAAVAAQLTLRYVHD